MKFAKQPLPETKFGVARLKQKGKPCHIAGVIETETKLFYRTVKTMLGYFIRARVKKDCVHLQPCEACPSEESVRRDWLQEGRDPNQVGLEPIM